MKIEIENLGPIQSGEIEIDQDLTVIVGSNHAGLSLVAQLIYGCQSIVQYSPYSQALNEAYKQGLYQAFQNEDPLDDFCSNEGLSIDIAKFLDRNALLFYEVRESIFQEFSTDFFASPEIKPRIRMRYELSPRIFTHNFSNGTVELAGEKYEIQVNEDQFIIKAHGDSQFNQEAIKDFVYPRLHELQNQCVFHFPIERLAIHSLARDLCKLIEREEASITSYPLGLRDYLAFANDPITRFQAHQDLAVDYPDIPKELGQWLEQALLKGSVRYSPESGICFSLGEQSEELEIQSAPALFKSLSGFALYLKDQARFQDILILEEPEQSLHPETQVQLARLIARLVNHQVQVILYTHSDYISRELSNLIVLAQDFAAKPQLLEKYGYQKEELLAIDQVSVYTIQDQELKVVPISEQGIEINELDGVITDMNQRSDDIFYSSLND